MTRDKDSEAYQLGLESARNDGDWRDNPYRVGSTAWFQCEDGRADGGAEDVGPVPGTAPWM